MSQRGQISNLSPVGRDWKQIGKSQETIENACQEIYTSVHEDEEEGLI